MKPSKVKNPKNIYFKFLTGLPAEKVCKICLFFTGLMPINFSREKFEKIKKRDYCLLEKSDGIRYILLTGLDTNYLIDRNFLFYKIHGDMEDNELKKKGTILDGELSLNLIREDYDYLLYDVVSVEGDWRVSTWDLLGRICILEKTTRREEYLGSSEEKYLKKKDFFKKYNIQILLDNIHSNLFLNDFVYSNQKRNDGLICNKNDGVILTPSKLVYSSKYPNTIFKWKYENGNSMDFLNRKSKKKISVTCAQTFRTYLFCRNNKNDSLAVDKLNINYMVKELCIRPPWVEHEKIEEFRFEKKKGKWIFKKKRTDKKMANSIIVLLRTLENIAESFLKKELVDKILKQNLRDLRGKIII